MVRAGLLFLCAFFMMATTVEARPRIIKCDVRGCTDRPQQNQDRARSRTRHRAEAAGTTIIGGRPAGCPHRYCGCGLRLYLGLSDKRLNLAWNWAVLFHRTTIRPRVAAVRRGHVLYIEDVVDYATRTVIARDYNSGGGLSRIHERRLGRGYVFVDVSQKVAGRWR